MIRLNKTDLKNIIYNECDKSTRDEVGGIRKLVLQTKTKNMMLLKELVLGCREVKKAEANGQKIHPNSNLVKNVNKNFELFYWKEILAD